MNQKEGFRVKLIDQFLDFMLFELGEQITVNGNVRTALVTDPSKSSAYYNDKNIRTKEPLSTGDVVTFRSVQWLAMSQPDSDGISTQVRIRKSNHVTKFILDDWLYEFVSILEMQSLSIDAGKIINLAVGKLLCTLPAGDMSDKIAINARFVASDAAWKVSGVDKTEAGLVILSADRDSTGSGDDMKNEIANADTIPKWTIGVTDSNRKITLGTDYPYTAVMYRNGSEFANACFLWQSSDSAVVSVSAGVATGVSIGTSTITVSWDKHPTVQYSFDVKVEEKAPDAVSYRIYCSAMDGSNKSYTDFRILQGDTMKYGIEKYVNGILAINNDTYIFSLNPNSVPSSYYVYTVVDAYSIKIINQQMYTNDQLTLTGTSDQSGIAQTVNILLGGEF